MALIGKKRLEKMLSNSSVEQFNIHEPSDKEIEEVFVKIQKNRLNESLTHYPVNN